MDSSFDVREGTLLIVWNADSGWQNAVLDSLHKWTSPQTYSCKLCQLTYGVVGPKSEWKNFLNSLDRDVLVYHRDEITASGIQLPFSPSFPMILERGTSSWNILIGAEELTKIGSIQALLAILGRRLLGD